MEQHLTTVRPPVASRGLRIAAIIALPAMSLLVAYVSYALFDRLGAIGPLDKAKLAWLVTVPLVAAAPGLASVTLQRVGTRRGLIALGILSAGVAIVTAWLLVSTETRIGCRVINSVWEALPNAASVGATAGLSLFGASVAASRVGQRIAGGRKIATFGIGTVLGLVAGAVTLFALSSAFPAVSCAPPIHQ
jgi:hypothetical protein